MSELPQLVRKYEMASGKWNAAVNAKQPPNQKTLKRLERASTQAFDAMMLCAYRLCRKDRD